MKRQTYGFTLIELLVVIGIIGILITVLVPVVKGAQTKAKEMAVKVAVANISAGLNSYAQSHSGAYPGVALDVMAPFTDHALGDNTGSTPLYTGSPGSNGVLVVNPGQMVNGLLGGFGFHNNSTQSVFQQIKTVKDTPIAGNEDTGRWFDSLIISDSLQEYPVNPFLTSAGGGAGANQGGRARMKNIFWFSLNDVGNNFDPSIPGMGFDGGDYGVGLYTNRGGVTTGSFTNDQDFDLTRGWLEEDLSPVTDYSPESFAADSAFGTDEDDFFSAGDFAYVPVLSSSFYPFGDAAPTLENESFKWGTAVTGYYLFGYGHGSSKKRQFEDEAREFAATGIDGYGAPGVDTAYEYVTLQCFEGAVYFTKQ